MTTETNQALEIENPIASIYPGLPEWSIEQLQQPLDPKRVKHRQGGGGAQLSYLKGHDVIDAANRIFGFGCWGYNLLANDLYQSFTENGEANGHYFAARVKVYVKGCIAITEEGVCAVTYGRNPRANIDAFDMARKGAITDAMKRALRCYGDQFGNSLYDGDLIDGQEGVLTPAGKQAANDAAKREAEINKAKGNTSAAATAAQVKTPTPIRQQNQAATEAPQAERSPGTPAGTMNSLIENYSTLFPNCKNGEEVKKLWSEAQEVAKKGGYSDALIAEKLRPIMAKRWYELFPDAKKSGQVRQPAKTA
jgi:DNA recombination protein Rad52